MSNKRLEELESKVSYQEYTISQLDEIVCEQQEQITQIKKQLDQLTKRLQKDEGDKSTNPSEERPPHY